MPFTVAVAAIRRKTQDAGIGDGPGNGPTGDNGAGGREYLGVQLRGIVQIELNGGGEIIGTDDAHGRNRKQHDRRRADGVLNGAALEGLLMDAAGQDDFVRGRQPSEPAAARLAA